MTDDSGKLEFRIFARKKDFELVGLADSKFFDDVEDAKYFAECSTWSSIVWRMEKFGKSSVLVGRVYTHGLQ